jgi:hypothetical protein
MNIALWIVQWLLALLFLFAGGSKFIMPVEEMTKQMPSIPGWFVHFIGVCELLGATAVTLMTGEVLMALIPLVSGILAAFVAYGRWKSPPLSN